MGKPWKENRELLRYSTKNKIIVHLRIVEKCTKSSSYSSDMPPFLIPMISLLSVFYSISSLSSPFLIFYTTAKLKQLDMKHGLPYLLGAYYGRHLLIY